MSPMIYLTNDRDSLSLPKDSKTVWLHHKSEPTNAERMVDLPTFLGDPRAAVRGADLMIVCGLVTKLCNPANRVKLGQFLTEPWWGPPRVSVDRCLFVGEPWRMWWHWGCVQKPFAEYFTSYRLESDWRRYIDTEQGNPCALERVVEFGSGVVEWRGGFRFDRVVTHVEKMSSEAHERYRAEKAKAFDEEKTPAAIIRRLGEFAFLEYPLRSVPKDIFARSSLSIAVTDFAVDRYLVGRIMEMVSLTNGIAEAFAC